MFRVKIVARPVARGRFLAYVREGIAGRLFSRRGWPEVVGGLLLGLVNILYFVLAGKPFSIYTGFLNWGRHVYELLGLSWLTGAPRASPLAERTSVGDLGLLLGALLAAVAAGEFRLRRTSLEGYFDAVLGGLLMALGVVFAFGCNWGGFFSAITSLSLHGYAMMAGLVVGGYLGLRYVEWRSERLFEKALEKGLLLEGEAGKATGAPRGHGLTVPGPAVAALLALLAVIAVARAGGPVYAALLLLGMVVGVVLQRARFCFATAFRDLFGGAEQARAARLQAGIALGIVVGATGVAALKYTGAVDPLAYVKPVGPLNILGGVLFGFGMAIAGGCASGSLWKAAEGNTGLLAALLAAVLSYPILRTTLGPLAREYASNGVFLPDLLGWAGALALVYASMLGWALFSAYLAYRRGVDPWGEEAW
jgi:hypothetical protein